MKRRIALILIFALCLSLCACGQETEPAQEDQATQAPSATAEAPADGPYVEEMTAEDGTVITFYHIGSPEGPVEKIICNYPDGAHSEEYYNGEATLEYMIYTDVEGTVYESYFYPSGGIAKDIIKSADGSYTEVHFLDNGVMDAETGVVSSGTICYEKYVTADGQIREHFHDVSVEDDGTWWDTEEWGDGTIVQTHYNANGMPIEQILDNESNGHHTVITYYENGTEKTRDAHYSENHSRTYIEYYENGSVAYSLLEYDDGSKREERINEAGYTTYYLESTIDMEFFANDVGELVKYVSQGTVYENDAIPGTARDIFNQVRTVPAEGSTTTENADGSSNTTTTYADGSTVTSGTTAEGTFTHETVSANGDRYFEEYFATGTLKLMISETADTYQEVHYDEDGYWIYFHLKAPGYEMEITCDETGKVNKVLVNGQEQTDIESHVKDMFFRSW